MRERRDWVRLLARVEGWLAQYGHSAPHIITEEGAVLYLHQHFPENKWETFIKSEQNKTRGRVWDHLSDLCRNLAREDMVDRRDDEGE